MLIIFPTSAAKPGRIRPISTTGAHKHRRNLPPWPKPPARRRAGRTHEILGRGRYRRVVEIDLQVEISVVAPDRETLDHDGSVTAVEECEHLRQLRLRLDGDDARPEPPERGHPIADMGA